MGTVVSFDEHVGLGEVSIEDETWAFHCTSIADGTRTIDVGTEVAFVVRAAGPGRWEAFELRSLSRG